mmetsp:Transcript_56073/g.134382  ORF Transcript_56073/g.134382 Transcript_56073/m.134382 type:complete len:203 (+) Transcript_56073:356-964(+)
MRLRVLIDADRCRRAAGRRRYDSHGLRRPHLPLVGRSQTWRHDTSEESGPSVLRDCQRLSAALHGPNAQARRGEQVDDGLPLQELRRPPLHRRDGLPVQPALPQQVPRRACEQVAALVHRCRRRAAQRRAVAVGALSGRRRGAQHGVRQTRSGRPRCPGVLRAGRGEVPGVRCREAAWPRHRAPSGRALLLRRQSPRLQEVH